MHLQGQNFIITMTSDTRTPERVLTRQKSGTFSSKFLWLSMILNNVLFTRWHYLWLHHIWATLWQTKAPKLIYHIIAYITNNGYGGIDFIKITTLEENFLLAWLKPLLFLDGIICMYGNKLTCLYHILYWNKRPHQPLCWHQHVNSTCNKRWVWGTCGAWIVADKACLTTPETSLDF